MFGRIALASTTNAQRRKTILALNRCSSVKPRIAAAAPPATSSSFCSALSSSYSCGTFGIRRGKTTNNTQWIVATVAAVALAWNQRDESNTSVRTNCQQQLVSTNDDNTTGSEVAAAARECPITNKYELKEILGHGAFGQVYRARRKSDNTTVALKQMDREFVDEKEFKREVNALRVVAARGGHEHICNLFDVQTDHDEMGKKDYYYMAMELVEGGELLEHLIQNGAYSEQHAAVFLRQFAEALSFVHSAGLAHADLKCENIMLSSWDEATAQVKLIDFGAAITVDQNGIAREEDIGEEGFMGTVAYCAPEILRGEENPSLASDMFAAGCIVYILLTGTHPFDPSGDATDEKMIEFVESLTPDEAGAKLLETAAFDDERVSKLSTSCVNLMKKLLHPDPKKRMTADEFRRHPWIQGLEASWTILSGSDARAMQFWQKHFRDSILKKFAKEIDGGDGSLSDKNLQLIFQAMDIDGSGSLDGYELRKVIRQLGVSENEASLMIASIDAEKSGDVDFPHFKKIMRHRFDDGEGVKRMIEAKKQFRTALLVKFANRTDGSNSTAALLNKRCLRRIFKYIDLDSNGLLGYDEIKTFMIQLGVPVEDVAERIGRLGLGHDAEVDFERFCGIMRTTFDLKDGDEISN